MPVKKRTVLKSKSPDPASSQNIRIGNSVGEIKQALLDNLAFIQGRFRAVATPHDYYMALAYTVRDRLLHKCLNTVQTYYSKASRTVCYLSAEFLMGPHLGNNMKCLGIDNEVRQALKELDLDLDALVDLEEEPGLGNGGLGRLAACYLDSMATLAIPSIGYGIRYEFGIFDQEIRDGWQVEVTDKWLSKGNPWEIARPEIAMRVNFGGHTEQYSDAKGRLCVRWVPDQVVNGVAYDTPVLGYKANTANMLRLWKAEACESFDFKSFNVGDYYRAVQEKIVSENLSKVLYPNDDKESGKMLRLKQQYFFVSCSLQDMFRIFKQRSDRKMMFSDKYAVQLNDTHPAIAVAELMRLLVDEEHYSWDEAWDVTKSTFAYTNHTLLPEALEKWPVDLFASVLPRHMEIIYEINRRLLDQVRLAHPGDDDLVRNVSIIDEQDRRYVRMANLACAGSSCINGVAVLHSDLLKRTVLKDFYRLWPERFTNVTNGVTPRRFILLSNPRLAELVSSRIGDGWVKDLEQIGEIEKYAADSAFCSDWGNVKLANKVRLAGIVKERTGVVIDPDSIYDVQAKRIHEYKRQHLNILHVIYLYNRLKYDSVFRMSPRTVILAGKAAPGYHKAKLIIKLAGSVADVVNNDPRTRDFLKVVFFPDFNVKNAQSVYPAADLSEQISTAGKEASGTGNMKFAMNGALTIGTLDGANIEIMEAVGRDNFFLFGLSADEVMKKQAEGYMPLDYYYNDNHLKSVIDLVNSGYFSNGDTGLFRQLTDPLLSHDEYMLMADFRSYVNRQHDVSDLYSEKVKWIQKSILNSARMGFFSSDRSIREYAERIWHVKPENIE